MPGQDNEAGGIHESLGIIRAEGMNPAQGGHRPAEQFHRTEGDCGATTQVPQVSPEPERSAERKAERERRNSAPHRPENLLPRSGRSKDADVGLGADECDLLHRAAAQVRSDHVARFVSTKTHRQSSNSNREDSENVHPSSLSRNVKIRRAKDAEHVAMALANSASGQRATANEVSISVFDTARATWSGRMAPSTRCTCAELYQRSTGPV